MPLIYICPTARQRDAVPKSRFPKKFCSVSPRRSAVLLWSPPSLRESVLTNGPPIRSRRQSAYDFLPIAAYSEDRRNPEDWREGRPNHRSESRSGRCAFRRTENGIHAVPPNERLNPRPPSMIPASRDKKTAHTATWQCEHGRA